MSETALFLSAFGLGWCSCLVFQRVRLSRRAREQVLDLTEAQRRRRAP